MENDKEMMNEKGPSPATVIRRNLYVPIWEKSNLTLAEAAEYSNIGIEKLREMTLSPSCKFVLWIGNRRVIKRKKFDEYIENSFSI